MLQSVEEISKKDFEMVCAYVPSCMEVYIVTHLSYIKSGTKGLCKVLQCIYRQNTHGILHQNISIGLGQFWDDFPPKKSERDLDPLP